MYTLKAGDKVKFRKTWEKRNDEFGVVSEMRTFAEGIDGQYYTLLEGCNFGREYSVYIEDRSGITYLYSTKCFKSKVMAAFTKELGQDLEVGDVVQLRSGAIGTITEVSARADGTEVVWVDCGIYVFKNTGIANIDSPEYDIVYVEQKIR